jgi:hypothetical protein
VRATTARTCLAQLDRVNVTAIEFLPTIGLVTGTLCRRLLLCPHCVDHDPPAEPFCGAAGRRGGTR